MDTKFDVGSRVVTPNGKTGFVAQVSNDLRLVTLYGPDGLRAPYFEHELKDEPVCDDHPNHSSPKEFQIGGNHYKDMVIQPIEYILKNKIGFAEGCIIKYVSRHRSKGGVEDLKKARHFLDLLIEHEERKP
jgi:hypothetical protein